MQVFWWSFSPPHGRKEKHQEGNKKNAMMQHRKDRMLVKIKGYLKPVECRLEAHMGYDGKNKDMANPNGKHQ
jgi:hypothetical protein